MQSTELVYLTEKLRLENTEHYNLKITEHWSIYKLICILFISRACH